MKTLGKSILINSFLSIVIFCSCESHEQKADDAFENFKEDILATFEDYLKINNGILRKSFDEFIMNDSNCEANLTGTLVI